MITKSALKPLPKVRNHKCFGCSQENPHGLQMEFFTDEKLIYSWVTIPDHLCGWSNIAHGGVVSTILDEVMGRSMIYLLKSLGLTKAMTVQFLKPVLINRELRAEGSVIEVKNSREALIQGALHDDEGKVCARSTGTFALADADRIRKMGIASVDVLEWYEEFIASRTDRSDR